MVLELRDVVQLLPDLSFCYEEHLEDITGTSRQRAKKM